MLYKSWLYRFLLPLLTYITPLLVNLIIFDQNELNGYKGFVAYFSVLSTFVYFLRSQRHRITHISGYVTVDLDTNIKSSVAKGLYLIVFDLITAFEGFMLNNKIKFKILIHLIIPLDFKIHFILVSS